MSWRPRLTVTNLEITRQRHEERMAERRRGAGNRVVTQTFGFDLPLIIATPPGVRAQKAAQNADAAKPIVEQPVTVTSALEPIAEAPQRRQSARRSRGSSVPSGTPVKDVVVESEGSSRKRRRLDSRSPAGTASSRRSASMIIEATPDIESNSKPAPEITTTEADPSPIPSEPTRNTPVLRSTPRVSPRRSLAPPTSSVGLSSPSPLSAESLHPLANSSVSPEPLRFIPDPPDSKIAITPETAKTPIDMTILSTPLAAATGLRATRRKVSKPAVAAVTPVPRGKRRRQPSPDKFLTPPKGTNLQHEGLEDDQDPNLSVEQIGRHGADVSQLANGHSGVEPDVSTGVMEVAASVPKRRGRKPKAKKPSMEIPVEDIPIQEEEPVLSDVEPEAAAEESYDQVVISGRLEEAGEDEAYEEVVEEEEEEEPMDEVEEVIDEPSTSRRPRKRNANAPRRPRPPGPSKRRNENGEPKETFDITVYRIPKGGDLSFKFPNNPNNIDIINEFLLEIIDKQLNSLSLRKNDEKNREEKARVKIREAVATSFSSELENRMIGMASKADNIKMKSVELRRLQREKLQLRDELMQIRESREDVARQMDAVRKKHEEGSEKANRQQFLNDTLKQIGAALEQGRTRPSARKEEIMPAATSLDALLASVSEDLCGPGEDLSGGGGKGILEQVKEMNRFLEAATEALRKGR
ncbi:hypothetical protein Dda_8643 [Drechslerella dactyloides]|uniref:Inner kinetochore subunit AME1 domain-containing protein n=1 Tax=Drechslerella dactyloides TaxID=74499 RepID=A0AAD6IQZ0_DREDA|nr:hypothetical protein Dda_8643 [Drechslerella dactyloides]